MQSRRDRFMPRGVPRYIRVYDNKGASIDRFTVVFTRGIKQPGFKSDRTYFDICMSAAPTHPQGVCQHGEHGTPIDCPNGRHLGTRIRFRSLPIDCQKVVIKDYKYLYDIDQKGAA